MESQPRIVIAGAGPVGLLAAQSFLRLGYQPVVYEKRSRSNDNDIIQEPTSTPHTHRISSPPPWGSRDRTRGIALNGSVIDAIRQLSHIDLLEYPGLHQVHRLFRNVDGEYGSTDLPEESGWWRSPKSTFCGAKNIADRLTASDLYTSIIDEPPVAMIGIAELEHYFLTDDLAVEFGMEVVGVKPETKDIDSKLKVYIRNQAGEQIEDRADLLLIATGGGPFHSRVLPNSISNTQSHSLLADLKYSLQDLPLNAVLLLDVAWSVPTPNDRQVLGVYGNTGFASLTGIVADFPEFSKVTVTIPSAIVDDVDGQTAWVHDVATALGVEFADREIVFEGRYWAYHSKLTSLVSPISSRILAIGDAYARTTPMNGRNFQTAIPLLMRLVEALGNGQTKLDTMNEWLSATKQIDNVHQEFSNKILDISYRVGRPMDEVAYERQRSKLSRPVDVLSS